MSFADATALVAIIGSVVAIYWAWRKTPVELGNMQTQNQQVAAEVILKYLDALGSSGEQVRGLAERVRALEDLTSRQENEIEDLRQENKRISDWASRLAHQVQALGAVPVAYSSVDSAPAPKKKIISPGGKVD